MPFPPKPFDDLMMVAPVTAARSIGLARTLITPFDVRLIALDRLPSAVPENVHYLATWEVLDRDTATPRRIDFRMDAPRELPEAAAVRRLMIEFLTHEVLESIRNTDGSHVYAYEVDRVHGQLIKVLA